ncbi:MAG: hypothetical protein KID00_13475 [Clostridium argentinense]|uniref:Uncharacterized protein n=1 Tax=Clostridium faecium TaxID=2762223 RepID=A0ABR8YX38_9CLOT|nr:MULTISPECIES: hypothetical protein [Clostridium]MBD8048846.1 hypothetical protein [Clostridium faecium]MBS5824835.1 hypothetical protein [Clostridium argentinense]MDU1349222.1 hypothetical protein [Clostridium argentinense]
MSTFLTPIHTWIFNKIILFEDIERAFSKAYILKYGETAKTIINQSKLYGEMINIDKNLEDIIDLNDVNGWFQNKIANAETRQAFIITELKKIYGEEVEEIAAKFYRDNGVKCGLMSKEKENPNNVIDIFNSMNNYLLEGMPCDEVQSIITKKDNIIEWCNSRCIHKSNYDKIGGNVDMFYRLRFQWLASFVRQVNNKYKFEYDNSLNKVIYKIIKVVD